MFITLIISKKLTKCHYSSVMVNGIGRAHKPGKQNRQQPGNINETFTTTLPTSYCHDNSDEKLM